MNHLIATPQDIQESHAIRQIQESVEAGLETRDCEFPSRPLFHRIQKRGIDTVTVEVAGVRYRIQISRDVQLMTGPVAGSCREDVSH